MTNAVVLAAIAGVCAAAAIVEFAGAPGPARRTCESPVLLRDRAAAPSNGFCCSSVNGPNGANPSGREGSGKFTPLALGPRVALHFSSSVPPPSAGSKTRVVSAKFSQSLTNAATFRMWAELS